MLNFSFFISDSTVASTEQFRLNEDDTTFLPPSFDDKARVPFQPREKVQKVCHGCKKKRDIG